MFRQYPLISSSKEVFTSGLPISQKLLAGISITTLYGQHDVYVSNITCKNNAVSASVIDNATGIMLGSFQAKLTSSYQEVAMIPNVNYASGFCVFGEMTDLINLNGSYNVSYESGRIEPSCVFCVTPPGVSGISYNGNTATGDVSFEFTNIKISGVQYGYILLLQVIDPTKILGGIKNSSYTCGTPIITDINGVTPDSNGNINLYSISPITLLVDTVGNKLSLGTVEDYTLDIACPALVQTIPPTNNSDSYYTDILATEKPEYKTW